MNELVVSKSEDGLRIAILQEKKIVELHHEKLSEEFSVGDLVLGKVKKIVPGLNAAFVDVGHPRDAFLHYFDLGPQVRSLLKYLKAAKGFRNGQVVELDKIRPLPDINKHGKMEEVLKPNQDVLVQVVKEPISTKGPRLSSEISLPGQYVVLVPFAKSVSVSKKIRSSDERRRLRVLAESLCPKNFGLIVRTAATGKDAATLGKDIFGILDKWKDMSLALGKAKSPTKVLSESNRATSILRDMLSQGFDTIHTDDKQAFQDIETYLKNNQPEYLKALKLYKGKVSLFQAMGLEKQIKASFGKIASMANGAYLVIEHTEAMHVIDVNSGSKNLNNNTLEETALKVNLEAATEIARQLRLRDMGGIIVVDFIDLKKPENRKILNDHFRKVMKQDRAKHSILPMSKFGLVQITRQRVRPQIDIQTSEVCPSCNGTGKIQASILIADEISNNLDYLIRQNKERKLTIVANPYVSAYLRRGFLKSFQFTWFHNYWVWVKIKDDTSLPFTEVKYYNSEGEEIKF
ncbi:Rne/Rng family ribonuclease [Pontibacter sp. G13]|uniref:Rne/Rng family ribonuclease n=1 Tax=Pontibacter sp. G13 TaxID=3074898 RepID=UPI00288BB545|nr:Rne/Rng family ribonuclease [Pontibacter sp. G13]WNJ20815.1 Rne/Rng family ribonuclease [Pontibacter sp. G13]